MRPAALRHAHCRRALGVRRHRLLRPGRLSRTSVRPRPEKFRDERTLGRPRRCFLRFNAAKSLEQLGFGYRDLIHVIEGHDRYAAEILRYRFDVRELEERKEDAACSTV